MKNGYRLLAAAVMVCGAATSVAAQDVVLDAADVSKLAGRWVRASQSGTSTGTVIRNPNANAAKITTAKSSPSDYFEMTFTASAGKPYRLWIRGRAENDYWGNDSVFIQFSGSVTSSGSSVYRMGTTSAAEMNLEECSGCGLDPAFVWQDNGYGQGVLGAQIYFATTGTHTLRVQTREDGLSIDQIVLSSSTYLYSAPSGPIGGTSTPSPTTGTLKVVSWNTHHGTDTAGVCSVDRIVDWIIRTGANVAVLNEVEKGTGWCSGEDQPARYKSLLTSRTGKTWYSNFAQRDGLSSGQGNLILTIFPLEANGDYLLSYSRSVARVQMLINGVRVNVFGTHLDADSSGRRTTQISELKNWADNYSEQRILAGDFNAWPGAAEISGMTSGHYDAWAVAVSKGTAVAYPGNEAGNTRNSRIDYVWYSRGASRLILRSAQVFDIRQSNGVSPSDHRPVLAVFEVR